MYWWMPDSSFVQYDPTLVEFPPFNFAEYRDGIFKSQIVTWRSFCRSV